MSRPSASSSSRSGPGLALLTLLFLAIVIAIGVGLFSWDWHRAYRKRQVAAEVKQLGGDVRFGKPPEATGLISGWLHLLLGDEYFAEAMYVALKPRSEEDLEQLRAYPELRDLGLSGPGVTDAVLLKLPDIVQLESLDVRTAAITELGLQSLQAQSNLRSVSFQACALFSRDCEPAMKRLTELPHLDSLSFISCRLSEKSLEVLSGARSLTQLHLVDVNISEATILALRQANPALNVHLGWGTTDFGLQRIPENFFPSVQDMPQVNGLAFRKPCGSDAVLATLRDARSLTHLQLSECPVSDEGLGNLRNLTSLTYLNLVGLRTSETLAPAASQQPGSSGPVPAKGPITDAGLEPISHLTALTGLTISNCRITDEGLRHFAPLKNLTMIFVGSPGITDAGLVHLQGLTNLRVLDLPVAHIEGPGLKWLPASIECLDLSATPVNDEGVAIIAEQLPQLQMLTLTTTRVTDAGLGHLFSLTSLRHLDVMDTSVTADGVAELGRALPGCQIEHFSTARKIPPADQPTSESPSFDLDALKDGVPVPAGNDVN